MNMSLTCGQKVEFEAVCTTNISNFWKIATF